MLRFFSYYKSFAKVIKSKIIKYNVPINKINSLKDGSDWINPIGNVIKNNILTTKNSKSKKYAFSATLFIYN